MRKLTNVKTNATIASTEFCEQLHQRHLDNKQIEREINYKEDYLKNRFRTNSDKITVSTIQSFKGWEANNVALIITEKDTPELIYTGITRTREQLLVINIGNRKFDEFFSNHQ